MSERQVNIVLVRNPFDRRDRMIKPVEFLPDRTLAEYVHDALSEYDPGMELVVSVNGRVVPESEIETRLLSVGDSVAICPRVTGENAGKDALKIIAGVALMIATMGVGSIIAGGAFLGAGFVGMASWGFWSWAAAMATSYVGGWLINQMVGTAQEQTKGSWSSIGAMAGEGTMLGETFGSYRTGGTVLAQHITYDGEKQYYNYLATGGQGEVDSINDIRIGDNPAKNYDEVEVDIRLGTNDQAVIPNFSDTFADTPLTYDLDVGVWRIQQGAGLATQGLEVLIECPEGLCKRGSGGSLSNATVRVQLQYRLLGAPTWTDFMHTKVTRYSADYKSTNTFKVSGVAAGVAEVGRVLTLVRSNGTKLTATVASVTPFYNDLETRIVYTIIQTTASVVPTDLGWVEYSTQTALAEITEASSSAVRRVYRMDNLPAGRYEVQAQCTYKSGTTTEYSTRVMWTLLSEIVYDDFARPGKVLLGLKALATDQLQGSLPAVTWLQTRANVWIWNPTANSGAGAYVQKPASNPAWAALWMLHRVYRIKNIQTGSYEFVVKGRAKERLDYQTFANWAAFCVERSLTINYHFRDEQSLEDALKIPETLGRGKVIMRGTKYSCIYDAPSTPVQLFSVGNITEGSFSEEFTTTAPRANAVELRFRDAARDFEERTILIPGDGYDASKGTANPTRVDLPGCTDADMAWRHGKYLLRLNKLIRSISWEADVDAIACQIGDVVSVQHDVPQWGVGGRLEGADVSGLDLDREVMMEPGKTYVVTVRHSDDALETKSLVNAAPTFTRNSPATLPDGSQVLANVPRFPDVAGWGKGLRVEEGATNVAAAGTRKAGTWHVQEYAWEELTALTLAVGDKVSISLDTKASTKTYVNGSRCIMIDQPTLPDVMYGLDTSKTRQQFVFTVTEAGGHNFYVVPSSASTNFEYRNYQLEIRSYCTSFTDATRSPESLSCPPTGLSLAEGLHVDVRFLVTANALRQVAGQFNCVANLSKPAGVERRGVALYHRDATNQWTLTTWNDADSPTLISFADSVYPLNSIAHFRLNIQAGPTPYAGVWGFDASGKWGELAKITNPLLPSGLGNIFIGSQNGVSNFLNADFCEFLAGRGMDFAEPSKTEPLPDIPGATFHALFDGNLNVTARRVNVATPYTIAPQKYDVYSYGESNYVTKPVRLLRVRRTSDCRMGLSGLEYLESVYLEATDAPTITAPALSAGVTGLKVSEQVDAGGRIRLTVSWVPPHGGASGARIAVNGKQVGQVGEGASSYSCSIESQSEITISVTAIGLDGKDYPAESLPYTPGSGHVPDAPTGVAVSAIFKGFTITLNRPVDPFWDGFEIHASTASGFTPDASTLKARDKVTRFTVSGLNAGAAYYVKAVAYGTNGAASVASAQVSVVTGKIGSGEVGLHAIQSENIALGAILAEHVAPETITPDLLAPSVLGYTYSSDIPPATGDVRNLMDEDETHRATWTLPVKITISMGSAQLIHALQIHCATAGARYHLEIQDNAGAWWALYGLAEDPKILPAAGWSTIQFGAAVTGRAFRVCFLDPVDLGNLEFRTLVRGHLVVVDDLLVQRTIQLYGGGAVLRDDATFAGLESKGSDGKVLAQFGRKPNGSGGYEGVAALYDETGALMFGGRGALKVGPSGLPYDAFVQTDQRLTPDNYICWGCELLSEKQTVSPIITDDTYVRNDAINYGTATALKVGGVGEQFYGLVHVPLEGASGTIHKATLRLIVTDITASMSAYARAIGAAWNATTAIGSTCPATTPDVSPTVPFRLGFVDIDITAIVQKWAAGTLANNGFELIQSGNSGLATIMSRESSAPPFVVIEYTPASSDGRFHTGPGGVILNRRYYYYDGSAAFQPPIDGTHYLNLVKVPWGWALSTGTGDDWVRLGTGTKNGSLFSVSMDPGTGRRNGYYDSAKLYGNRRQFIEWTAVSAGSRISIPNALKDDRPTVQGWIRVPSSGAVFPLHWHESVGNESGTWLEITNSNISIQAGAIRPLIHMDATGKWVGVATAEVSFLLTKELG